MSLLHSELKTSQRFTWLIGDLLEAAPEKVESCLPMLFDLREQMPFPGMRRSVGKCFYYCGVPKPMEKQVIPVLIQWLDDNQYSVSCKHYAAKVLFNLAIDARIAPERLDQLLQKQERHENPAHASRMAKQRIALHKKIERQKRNRRSNLNVFQNHFRSTGLSRKPNEFLQAVVPTFKTCFEMPPR